MMILSLILILVGSLGIVLIIISEQTDKITALGTLFSILFIIAGAGCLDSYKHPQAIDVYRGKTTLQITYKGSIPIDTTVVYK